MIAEKRKLFFSSLGSQKPLQNPTHECGGSLSSV